MSFGAPGAQRALQQTGDLWTGAAFGSASISLACSCTRAVRQRQPSELRNHTLHTRNRLAQVELT
jgi:hypothetical protein